MTPAAGVQRKILVVGPAWVGDMVMAQSLFKALHDKNSTVVDVIAPEWSLPLLERMPEVRKGFSLPLGHWQLGLARRWQIGRILKREQYDQAIVLPRSFKAALVPWFAGIPQRTGYRGESRYGLINDVRDLDKSVLTQTVQRFVALGGTAGADLPPQIPGPRLTAMADRVPELLTALELHGQQPAIAFMTGAEYGPAKQWPAEYFASLAKKLTADGMAVWLLGSAEDAATAEEVRRIAGSGVVNLCGKTTLVDAVDLIAHARLAITNDSGLMHIAAAVDSPLVAIYGSSTPDYTPPLTDKATVLYLRLDCSPCFKRTCPLGHTNCLNHLSPDTVYKAAVRRLESESP